MTTESKKMCGYILLSVPTIIYGGYFLLTVLSGQNQELGLTDFQKSMFRAGHAHAGVLVLLALIAQLLVDTAKASEFIKKAIRLSFPIAAIVISMGFFAAAIGDHLTKPNDMIWIIYLGIVILLFGLISLGLGLIKK